MGQSTHQGLILDTRKISDKDQRAVEVEGQQADYDVRNLAKGEVG